MRRLVYGLALVGAFLAGGVLLNQVVLQAQDKVEPKPRGTLYPKWRDLGLTKEQTEKIYRIQGEHRAKIDKLEAEIKKLKDVERAEAMKILTPAQVQRLKELTTGAVTPPPPEKDKTSKPTDK